MALNEVQVVQYLLDQCKDLKEVKSSFAKFEIKKDAAALHYFICERSGNCLVAEYVPQGKGKSPLLKTTQFASGDAQVITNDTVSNSQEHAKQNQTKPLATFNEAKYERATPSSLERYRVAVNGAKNFDPQQHHDPVRYMFNQILDPVWLNGYTVWNIVYDLQNLRVYYRTEKTSCHAN